MGMIFPYSSLTITYPVASNRYRPVIPVTVLNANGPGARVVDMLLDTGADDTLFAESLASLLGISLANAPAGAALTGGGVTVPVRYADVTLRIATTTERREWTATVGFAKALPKWAIAGHAGFLQFFDADFRGARREVELRCNSAYRGL